MVGTVRPAGPDTESTGGSNPVLSYVEISENLLRASDAIC